MKKNLFVLFSVYFFIVQPILAAILRENAKFLSLAVINLIILLLIILFYKRFDDNIKEMDQKIEKEAKKADFVEVSKPGQSKKSFGSKPLNFLLSIIVMFLLYGFIDEGVPGLKFFLVVLIGFVFYGILNLIFKKGIHHKGAKSRPTKAYIILLIISLIFGTYQYYLSSDTENSFRNSLKQIRSTEQITEEEETITEEEEIIQSGDIQVPPTENTGILLEQTGGILTTTVEESPSTFGTTEKITIMNAIKYLFETNNTPLSTKKDVKFTYISKDNSDYAYLRTAREKRTIGTNTNPNKFIICQTYIVMKGIVEGRTIPASKDVVGAYRQEAITRDELNNCQKQKIVLGQNL